MVTSPAPSAMAPKPRDPRAARAEPPVEPRAEPRSLGSGGGAEEADRDGLTTKALLMATAGATRAGPVFEAAEAELGAALVIGMINQQLQHMDN